MTSTPGWTLYGCRTTYAPVVAEVVWRRGEEISAVVDNLGGEPWPEWDMLGPLATPADVAGAPVQPRVHVPLSTPGHRHTAVEEALGLGLTSFPPLVDPHAIVGRTVELGEGSLVGAGVIVSARCRVGRFVQISGGSLVSHHVELEDFTSLSPRCVLAGHTVVETGAFIGVGAVLAPKVRIGANAVVGAGAVVIRDVPELAVVAGNPARVLRIAERGHGGGLVPRQ